MKTTNGIRYLCLSLALAVFAWGCGKGAPEPAAKPPAKVAVYNLLSHPILDASVEGIKKGLEEAGYVKGKNLTLIEVNANGQMEMLTAFAREVLSANPDVVVPVSTPVTQSVMREASPKQAVVFSTVTNPSDVGMDKHPANLTGVSDMVNYDSNVSLIRELFPKARRIGIIYNAGEANSVYGVEKTKEIAARHGLEILTVTIGNSSEIRNAAEGLSGRVDVFYVGSDNTVVGGIAALVAVAKSAKKPVIASDEGSVSSGALAAVSVNYEKLGRTVAGIVVQVLGGAPVNSIQPVAYLGQSLILNRAAAKSIGYEFSADILKRAEKVIE